MQTGRKASVASALLAAVTAAATLCIAGCSNGKPDAQSGVRATKRAKKVKKTKKAAKTKAPKPGSKEALIKQLERRRRSTQAAAERATRRYGGLKGTEAKAQLAELTHLYEAEIDDFRGRIEAAKKGKSVVLTDKRTARQRRIAELEQALRSKVKPAPRKAPTGR